MLLRLHIFENLEHFLIQLQLFYQDDGLELLHEKLLILLQIYFLTQLYMY